MSARRRRSVGRIVLGQFERRDGDVHETFASMLETDRDTIAHDALDLAHAPVGGAGQAHAGARDQKGHGRKAGSTHCMTHRLSPAKGAAQMQSALPSLLEEDQADPLAMGDDVDPLRLAELIAARLCHDLSGPIASVSAAAEMLADGSVGPADACPTLTESADAAARRIRYLRLAFGGVGGAMAATELAGLADGVPAQGRARLDWSGLPEDAELSSAMVRVLLVALLAAGEGLPRGGKILLRGHPSGGVVIELAGQDSGWPRALGPLLERGGAARELSEAGPRKLVPPLLVWMAGRLRVRITVSADGAMLLAPN